VVFSIILREKLELNIAERALTSFSRSQMRSANVGRPLAIDSGLKVSHILDQIVNEINPSRSTVAAAWYCNFGSSAMR
jgi:hypothetical protein